eukprot:627008_1
MGVLFNITMDSWIIGRDPIIATITLQTICLLITITLCIIRIHHICLIQHQLKHNWKFALLHYSQLMMMIFSSMYIFMHGWNYVHIFLPSNMIDCTTWLRLLLVPHPTTRICLFIFLMTRSSISFQGTFCHLPFKTTIPIIIAAIIGSSALIIELFTEAEAYHPLPNSGVCWRILTPTGALMGQFYHWVNCVLSIAVLVIFYVKARAVQKEIKILENNNDLSAHLQELQFEFNKHIRLGALAVAGNILIVFFVDSLTIMLGVAFALDQTVNNVLTTAMFEQFSSMYRCMCCSCSSVARGDDNRCTHDHVHTIIDVVNVPESVTSTQETYSTTTSSTNETTPYARVHTLNTETMDGAHGLKPINEMTALSQDIE